jgi:hypothetical protein
MAKGDVMKKSVVLAVLSGLAVASSAMAQLSTTNALPGAFIDISATGINTGNSGDDVSTIVVLPAA